MAQEFKEGDLVFAKVKGYPPWPGRIAPPDPAMPTTKTRPYLVFFFGTHEVSLCSAKDVIPFEDNRLKLATPKRMRGFNEGIWEIHNSPLVTAADPIGGPDRLAPVEEIGGQLVPSAEGKPELNDSVEDAQEATETPAASSTKKEPKRKGRPPAATGPVPEVAETPETTKLSSDTPTHATRSSGRVAKKLKAADADDETVTKVPGKRGRPHVATPARQSARMRLVKDDSAAEEPTEPAEMPGEEGLKVVEEEEAPKIAPVDEEGASGTGGGEEKPPSGEETDAPSEAEAMKALRARQDDLYDDETGSADEVQREHSSPPPLADRHLPRRNGNKKEVPASPEKPKRRWEKMRNLSVTEKPGSETAAAAETPSPSDTKRRGRPLKRHDDGDTPVGQNKKAASPIPEDPGMPPADSALEDESLETVTAPQEALTHVKALVRVELDIKQSLLINHFDFPRCLKTLEEFKVRLEAHEVPKDSLIRIPSLVETFRKCRKFTSCREIRQEATAIVMLLAEMFGDGAVVENAETEKSPITGEEVWFRNFKRSSEKFLRENKDWAYLLRDRFSINNRKRSAANSSADTDGSASKRPRLEESAEASQPALENEKGDGTTETQPEVPVEMTEKSSSQDAPLTADTTPAGNDEEDTTKDQNQSEEDIVLPDVKEIVVNVDPQPVDEDSIGSIQPPKISPAAATSASASGTSRPSSVSPALPLQPISMGTMRKDICDIDIE